MRLDLVAEARGQVYFLAMVSCLGYASFMVRPLRIEYPGAVYHVTSRGNKKKAVFKDDSDREAFLNTLAHVNRRYTWICHAYCLMDNHYPLLIETPEGNLSIGMRQLNGVYTQTLNRRHGRIGHLFQERFKAILIQKDSCLLEVGRDVVLNPVRAGRVEGPGDWKWSSYRATWGQADPHSWLARDWILGRFGRERVRAAKEYRQFVNRGIGKESIWIDVKGKAILGGDKLVDGLTDHLGKHKDTPDIPKSQRYANRPSLGKIFTEGVLRSKGKRDRKIVEAVEQHGYKQREVADQLGV